MAYYGKGVYSFLISTVMCLSKGYPLGLFSLALFDVRGYTTVKKKLKKEVFLREYSELFQRFEKTWEVKTKAFQLWGLDIEMIYSFPYHKGCMGNKLWKLYALYKKHKTFTHIFSHGSFQANSLLALSRFAKAFDKQLLYYVPRIPSKAICHPQSNYCLSKQLGAIFLPSGQSSTEQEAFDAYQAFTKQGGKGVWVDQGISGQESEKGIQKLGAYLNDGLPEKRPLCLPSGTGATAFFLSQSYQAPVITTSCIAANDFLLKAFKAYRKGDFPFPKILSTKKKYPFGALNPELFLLHEELQKKVNIDVDCLYDVKMFLTLKENARALPQKLYYLHCGGLEANASMWARYKRKYPL